MDTNRNRQTTHYQSYLLRLRQEDPEAEWRIVLKEIGTEEHHAFADMKELFDFLDSKIGPSNEAVTRTETAHRLHDPTV